MTKLLYTTSEAAELLGIGRTTLYLLLGQGAIESVKIGTLRRVSGPALQAYVEQLSEKPDRNTSLADGQRL
jgi:excisionase family DNA binding protein